MYQESAAKLYPDPLEELATLTQTYYLDLGAYSTSHKGQGRGMGKRKG